MMPDWGLLNFFTPLVNVLIFGVLFFVFFRKKFIDLAQGQRRRFLAAKLEAEKERRLLEKELEDLLFREREQAKNLAEMKKQAQIDAEQRAKQIIEDAQFHGARILEESKRLARAELEAARQTLREELIRDIEGRVLGRSRALSASESRQYTRRALDQLTAVASS